MITAAGASLLAGPARAVTGREVSILTRTERPYLGLIATGAGMFTAVDNSGVKFINSRTLHVAADNITGLMVAIANFYVRGNETGSGLTGATMRVGIEYPLGVAVMGCTFSSQYQSGGDPKTAALPAVAATGGETSVEGIVFTNLMPVNIPKGAVFAIRQYRYDPNGWYFIYGTRNTNVLGQADAIEGSTSSLIDKSQSLASINNASNNFSMPPCALIGPTTRPSVIVTGDSISYGIYNTSSSTPYAPAGDYRGIICGAWPQNLSEPPIAFINIAHSGAHPATMATWSPGRAQLYPYCTHMICELGINAFLGANGPKERTADELFVDQATYAATWPSNIQKYLTTLLPNTSSTDGWVTAGNQNVQAFEAARLDYNTRLRSGIYPPGYSGYFEIADSLEVDASNVPTRNGGHYLANGSAGLNGITEDGTHPTEIGYAISWANTGTLDLTRMRYP